MRPIPAVATTDTKQTAAAIHPIKGKTISRLLRGVVAAELNENETATMYTRPIAAKVGDKYGQSRTEAKAASIPGYDDLVTANQNSNLCAKSGTPMSIAMKMRSHPGSDRVM